jgi:hypothetical protein
MIGLASIEQVHANSVRVLPVVKSQDDKLSAILDVAEWYRWQRLEDGSREAWFILIKPLPGLPKGTALRLTDLHERLFGEPMKKGAA